MPALNPGAPPVAGLVLAAGSSSRLGQCKQLLSCQGETLIHRCVRQALDCGVGPVVCVLGHRAGEIENAITDLDAQTCFNPDWETGMSSSLARGIGALPATVSGALVLLCDQPQVLSEDLARLLAAWREGRIAAARYSGVLGVPAIFPRRMFADLSRLEGDRGARELLRGSAAAVLEVEMPNAAVDIDRRPDLEQFLRQ